MATSLNIDSGLIDEARRLGGHPTKRATINAALEDYVRKRRRLTLLKAFGTFEFDPAFD
jgi:Arc/MetJ family transcription regulator